MYAHQEYPADAVGGVDADSQRNFLGEVRGTGQLEIGLRYDLDQVGRTSRATSTARA